MATQTNQRDFIKLTALAGSGLLLPPLLIGYNSSPDGCPLMAKTDDPFEARQQMVELLEKGPDHFIGQRKALIASKDPKAMTEFVRDYFQLIPADAIQKPAPNSLSMVLGTTQDVSNLEVKALPKVFPNILLEVSPTHTAGEIVGGLTADDFE